MDDMDEVDDMDDVDEVDDMDDMDGMDFFRCMSGCPRLSRLFGLRPEAALDFSLLLEL